MTSRRDFLMTVGAGVGLATIGTARTATKDQPEIKTAFNGTVGLQLWSLREYLPKDLPGTLTKVRGFGFREVEGAGLWGHTVAEFRDALAQAGLRCQSAHMGYERLRDDLPGALAEAKALGATAVVCPWIPHGKTFTREDALKTAEAFNRFGKALRDGGLRFGYHCHGYEFVPAAEGTLFDTLVGATDASLVALQIDIFHAFHGGADPARLIEKHKGRVTSLHMKDLKKGLPVVPGTAEAQADADVPVGTGQIDVPAVVRAAVNASVSMYYVEDESADPLGHIPQSLAYLQALKV
jgi:sugar phosphate isomerase/epimerase